VCAAGYLPSFCTGCYRLGRTGKDFMDLAKPGLINEFCLPNAIMTFAEYLLDYATPATRAIGEKVIKEQLSEISNPARREDTSNRLHQISSGRRDMYF
ncbi:MAG: [FeFe] hydrogenase H-cluster radical SAM maturase HydG, partial [Lentisphaerae bacterium]|nr:[FeFe] hydrogenase H-cluster radical SAM maturase HydG [Lentisphaerota bacterium]